MSAGVFDAAASALEAATDFDRLEARGTLRIVLKNAGLEAGRVSSPEIAVAIRRLLPRELGARGVADPEAVCSQLAERAEGLRGETEAESPEAMFGRLDA